jgi:hypothetical protein
LKKKKKRCSFLLKIQVWAPRDFWEILGIGYEEYGKFDEGGSDIKFNLTN